MIARSHYDRDTLTRFLDDEAGDAAEMSSHIESCEGCRSTLESLVSEGLTIELAGELLRSSGDIECAGDAPNVQENSATSFLEPSDHPDSLGRFARYEIMEVLGRGGMGIVMRGYDTSLNRHSAVKVLAPELATSAAARNRFSREARSAAAVVHPHVVPIQTVDEHNGLPYLVMPVVEGQSVEARVRDSGPLKVIEAIRIAAQVAEGLAAAHDQGLVHRDIKPANVLLENGVERVQITDFGLARAADDASVTRSGVIAGTPQYMSPEQAHGDAIDHRSDLFSLGSLTYFLLTGRSPFRAETTMGVLNRIANDEPRSIRSINSEVPDWLEQIVMKLLSKSPDDRFESAAEVAELLHGCLAHVQHPAKTPLPESLASVSPRRGSSPPWIKLVAAAASAFTLLFAGVLIVLELNKGTLTIECDADDVPIRIMQGDKVVEELTVRKGAKSIGIAAGNYVVEIDGEFDGVQVENGEVSLSRGATEAVKITQTLSPPSNTPEAVPSSILATGKVLTRSNDSIEVSIGSDDGVRVGDRLNASNALGAEIQVLGVHADRSVARVIREEKSTPIKVGATVHLTGRPARHAWWGRLEWKKQHTHTSVHVAITGPPNTKFDYNHDGVPDRPDSVRISESYPDGLSVWLNHPKYGRMIAHLEPKTDVTQTEWLQHHSIIVRLTSEDLEHCHSGNAVTKVIYLPENSLEAMFGPNVVVSTRLDPGVNPLELAKDHGIPLLVVTLSLPETNTNAVSETPGSANPVVPQKVSSSSTGPYFAGSEPKLPPYLDRIPDQPDGSRSISDIVDEFNRSMQSFESDYPQLPLTVEEVLCCCLWKLQTKNDLTIETRKLLTDVGIGRQLPEQWAVEGGGFFQATEDGGLVSVYRVQLVSRKSDSKVVIRERFLEPPAAFKTPMVANSDETSMPLAAAIAEFNAMHHSINGKRQPPLTKNEVLAAIVHWKSQRNEAAVDNGTFARLQRIAQTHQMSVDARFEVISSFGSRGGDTFRIWSVRLAMAQLANPEAGYAFPIREQFVSVSSVHDSMIHWGKPNDDGLQAGIRLIPGQRVYQIGQSIKTEFLYRSISGKQIDATLSNVFSHQKLIAKDAEGNELEVVDPRHMTVGGAVQTTIGETPTRKQGQPLRLSEIAPAQELNFRDVLGTETHLIVKPKQKVFLQYEVSDLDRSSIRTGKFEIEIAGAHDEPLEKGVSQELDRKGARFVQVEISGPTNTKFVYESNGTLDNTCRLIIDSESHPDGVSVSLKHPEYGRIVAHFEPQANAAAAGWVQHNTIPVLLTDADLKHCQSGNVVTKVINFPHDSRSPVSAMQILLHTQHDPLDKAKRHGTPMMVVTLSKLMSDEEAASNESSALPILAPYLDGIPIDTDAFRATSNINDEELLSHHFESPEALMAYYADCQFRDDVAGCLDCYSDSVIEQFAASYLLTATGLQQMYRRLDPNPKGAYQRKQIAQQRERAERLDALLKRSMIEAPSTIAKAALYQAAGSIREEVTGGESREPTQNELMLAATAPSLLKNPRQFVLEFSHLSDDVDDGQLTEKVRNDYKIKSDTNGTWSIKSSDNSRMELRKFKGRWWIDGLWPEVAEKSDAPSTGADK